MTEAKFSDTNAHLSHCRLLQCTSTEDGSLTFGPLSSLPASQAIPVNKLDMILVLSPTAELQLYSGKTKVPCDSK